MCDMLGTRSARWFSALNKKKTTQNLKHFYCNFFFIDCFQNLHICVFILLNSHQVNFNYTVRRCVCIKIFIYLPTLDMNSVFMCKFDTYKHNKGVIHVYTCLCLCVNTTLKLQSLFHTHTHTCAVSTMLIRYQALNLVISCRYT